jgi:hypothetical protein
MAVRSMAMRMDSFRVGARSASNAMASISDLKVFMGVSGE